MISALTSKINKNSWNIRRFVTIIFFALVNANFIYSQSITITSPNGSETWRNGTGHDITWTYTETIINVNIEISTDGGSSWNLVEGPIPNNLSYPWTVPNYNEPDVRIKVSDPVSSANDISDANFRIISPNITNSPVKILPIGNSITFDNFKAEFRFAQDKISYRYKLWDLLRTNNYDIDFIGHKSGGYYQFPDPENGGIPGISDDRILTMLQTGEVWLGDTIKEIQATPGPYLNYYTPDIILLHIGTNGVHAVGGTSPDDVKEILNLIDIKSEDIWVVLALIIDDFNGPIPEFDPDITAFNDNIKSMAQERINDGDKIIIVDMQHDAGLIYLQDRVAPHDTGDLYDDIHPNDGGKAKMADLWFQGLQLILPNPSGIAPAIRFIPNDTAYVGLPYKYNVDDSVGVGAPDYSLTTKPTDMTINTKTGIIDWVPNSTGSFSVSVNATNSTLPSSSRSFNITVLPAPSIPNNIISYWNLDETGSLASFNDLPGINNALPINAPSIVPGIVGNALSFNGTNKVDVIDDSSLYFQKDESFTFETWVKTTQAGTNEPIFLGKDGGSTSYTLGINTSDSTKFEIKDSVGSTTTVTGPPINDENWHHVAGVVERELNRFSIFIDGERYSKSKTFHSSGFFSYDPLTLGYYKNDNFFNGQLDEVAIYNRRLPGFELARHYISCLAGKGYTDNYVLVNAKVFLQGPYNGTDMNITLNTNTLIPKDIHPYSSAPWNYDGLERVATYPVPDVGVVVDWVLVELRSDPNTVVASRAAFIKNDGNLVEIHDNLVEPRPIIFTGVSEGDYYIVIKHRNHLAIMSSVTIALTRDPLTTEPYDFTDDQGKAYTTGPSPMADLGGGVFGMFAGDANGDGGVFAEDYTSYQLNQGNTGYNILADFNLDGGAFAEDYTIYQFNQGKVTRVP